MGTTLAVTLLVAISTMIGCRPSTPRPPTQASRGLQQRVDQGDVLFRAVAEQMRDLASFIDTELQPPVVILDSKKSSDGQDVLATCGAHPSAVDGPINYLSVPNANSRFRSLGVRPGDIVKYYVSFDRESLETGIAQEVAIDLTVAQVLNDNALLIEGGLVRRVPEPRKIEIWRYIDDRLNDIAQQFDIYVRYRRPALDWEPSPDARVLKQIVERLNQWMRQSPPKTEWTADPLIGTMSPELSGDDRLAPLIATEALDNLTLRSYEGRLLQEAVWLRDVSRWAQGESFDPVARASALFDWTIRNIQLDAEDRASPNRPWQVLLYGHGTAEQRAWVFALLCRQQGLDVVVLSVPRLTGLSADGGGEDDRAPGASAFWLPALLHEGQLYLFDTRLGLPIPGPGGKQVATLQAVRADESLLRQLDLEDAPYLITADQLQNVTANVVADPFDLSHRARAIESRLSGDDRLTLTSRPSELAGKLASTGAVVETTVWDFPFHVLRDQLRIPIAARRQWAREFEPFTWRPTLWKARVLHFQGHRRAELDTQGRELDEIIDDHRQAVQLYTSRLVRPPDRVIAALGSPPRQRIYAAAKAGASYWVGLLLFDQGRHASAADWFRHPQLAAEANDPWTSGTRYNLARTYEAEGKTDEAVAIYEQDTSPQRHGNRLRARWLKSEAETNHQASSSSGN